MWRSALIPWPENQKPRIYPHPSPIPKSQNAFPQNRLFFSIGGGVEVDPRFLREGPEGRSSELAGVVSSPTMTRHFTVPFVLGISRESTRDDDDDDDEDDDDDDDDDDAAAAAAPLPAHQEATIDDPVDGECEEEAEEVPASEAGEVEWTELL
eukprot:6070779-Amphidinium_carterae.1